MNFAYTRTIQKNPKMPLLGPKPPQIHHYITLVSNLNAKETHARLHFPNILPQNIYLD